MEKYTHTGNAIQIAKVTLVSGLCALLAISCAKSNHEVSGGDGKAASENIEKLLSVPETIDYDSVKALVFSSHCIKCHDAREKKDGVDLSEYDRSFVATDGRPIIEKFSPDTSPLITTLSASGKRKMPPVSEPQLSSSQKRLLQMWVKMGAKRSKMDNAEPVKVLSLKEKLSPYFQNPEKIDYNVVKDFVFTSSCLKCHSIDGSQPDQEAMNYGANMTSYKTLFDPTLSVIVPGRPKASPLYTATVTNLTMPPAKEGYDPIDSLQMKLLRLWILNCAIEDYASIKDDDLSIDPKIPGKVRKCAEATTSPDREPVPPPAPVPPAPLPPGDDDPLPAPPT